MPTKRTWFKREISIEGVIAVVLLVYQLVASWDRSQHIQTEFREALDRQEKSIAVLLFDVGQIKSRLPLYDEHLTNEPWKR